MQGKKTISPKMMYQVHLDDLVAKDNIYRKLLSTLDFHFLYKATEKHYGREGQESIDPVVFFKICLVGYLNNINSDRRLVEYCSNCLDVRLFIQYDIDEPLPWHSTISRTRQLYGEEVFLTLFKKVLSLCIEKGMVRGKRQAIDSAYIKANASLDSLQEKEVLDDVEKYSEELKENSEDKITVGKENIPGDDKSNQTVSTEKKKTVDQHHAWKAKEYKDQPGHSRKDDIDEHGNIIRPKFLSNHTHYSATDPDARISVKPGKARQMNYSGQIAVDDAHHVITGAMADYADKRDSQSLPKILEQTINNLNEENIELAQITADAGYSSGKSLQFIESKHMDAYIPNFGQYKYQREGFIYNKEKDQYECTRGNKAVLPFKTIRKSHDNYEMKVYRSSETICKHGPVRTTCIGEKTHFKKIEHSLDKPLYDKMHEKMQTEYAKRITRIRSSTVEPVLGTLMNFLNMKRVNTRGIRQANKHVLMAALTYNLKKYLKFITRKSQTKLQALRKEDRGKIQTTFFRFIRSLLPKLEFTF